MSLDDNLVGGALTERNTHYRTQIGRNMSDDKVFRNFYMVDRLQLGLDFVSKVFIISPRAYHFNVAEHLGKVINISS